jgi:hypothetical protein
MRFFISAALLAVVVNLLAACSSAGPDATSSLPSASGEQSHIRNGRFVPVWSPYASLVPVESRPGGLLARIHALRTTPDQKKKAKGGIYVSAFEASSIFGYANPNRENEPQICSVGPVADVNGIGVDGKGNLIDPDGHSHLIVVFKGPGMCGTAIGFVSDSYGQPADATSPNAQTGTIVVANIFDTSGAGSISLCTLSGGCTKNLTNAAMYEVSGVAQAKNDDCWASGTNYSGVATLTYFQRCRGSGHQATGYKNKYYGGLDIDKHGNIVAISVFDASVYVYKGCNPACKLVGGPFSLVGESSAARLNENSNQLAVANFYDGEIDVYDYSPGKITLSYAFNNGLSASEVVEGVAFNPRSQE